MTDWHPIQAVGTGVLKGGEGVQCVVSLDSIDSVSPPTHPCV